MTGIRPNGFGEAARRRGWLAAVVLLVAPAVLLASETDTDVRAIPQFSAVYELERNGMRAAELTRTLSCRTGRCEFRSVGQTVGFADLLVRGRLREITRFGFSNEGIRPRDYTYRQRARGNNDENVRLFFNPDTGRVSSRGDDEWEKHIDGEVMDELLSQLRLMLAVRAGEDTMSFSVIEGDGDREAYRFSVAGREEVATDAGRFEAVRVEHVGDKEERQTTMWFATELEYIPLVVRQENEDDANYTATLTRIEEDPELYRP